MSDDRPSAATPGRSNDPEGTRRNIIEVASREFALRSTWFLNALVHLALFLAGRHLLTTAKIEAARAEAVSSDADATA